jgi:hypothetical protein
LETGREVTFTGSIDAFQWVGQRPLLRLEVK